MSEKFRLDRKIGFQNTFYTKGINVIINSIGPSIILRSIVWTQFSTNRTSVLTLIQTILHSDSVPVRIFEKVNFD